jgi:hypothetical protein
MFETTLGIFLMKICLSTGEALRDVGARQLMLQLWLFTWVSHTEFFRFRHVITVVFIAPNVIK